MKILLTATVQSHICQFHKPLVEMLHEHNCEVHVAARDNLAEKNGLKLDFAEKVFNVPFSRSPKSKDNIKAYKQLKKIIDEGQYDVIHCNTPMGGIVTRLAARKARKNGTKVFYTAHGFHFYKSAPKKNWIVFYPIEKFFANHYTDKLITITNEDYDLANEKFKCQIERIHGVGVDEKRYFSISEEEKKKFRLEMGYNENQKLILCIGELLPNKNQQMAIRMMPEILKKYPDAMLLIAGNGPEKNNLDNLIAELGLKNNVKLLGYVTNLEDYQHIADMCVSCSKREGLPLNIVEAMMSGTPVVATYNRGHRELIIDEQNGYLVSINDNSSMIEKVLTLLDDINIYKSTSKNAILKGNEYSKTAVIEDLRKVYSNVFK